jgi:hypothetical protein
VQYNVKNTFVQASPDVSMLFPKREILSCPASKVGCMILPRPAALDMSEVDELEGVSLPTWPVTPLENWPSTLPPTPAADNTYSVSDNAYYNDYSLLQADTMFVPADVGQLAAALDGYAVNTPPWLWQPSVVPPPPPTSPPKIFQMWENPEMEQAIVDAPSKSASVALRLADSIQAPELGSAPTVGSVGHHFGNCKPCAFLHKQGCENGTNCQFCHLCDAGEKKRRQKMKKAQLQSMKQQDNARSSLLGSEHDA